MKIFYLLAICLVAFNAYPQIDPLATDFELLKQTREWNEGTVTLKNETVLKGLVRYNDREDYVSFNDGENIRVFTAHSLLHMVFFDANTNKTRTLYSFPFSEETERAADDNRYYIFEVLKEFKEFAILLRTNPIALKTRRTTTGPAIGMNGVMTGFNTNSASYTEVTQEETVYILEGDGTIKPYLQFKYREDGTRSLITGKDRKTKTKIKDKDLLADFVGQAAYEKIVAYAETQKLSFKKKDDFLAILNYYDSIKDEN